jgi:histidine ammonia-lyase
VPRAEAAGCEPVALEAKEGLALLNGTQLSTRWRSRACFAPNLLGTAITAGALSVEGLAGSYTPFDDRIHAARGLAAQREVAARFRGC